MIEGGLAGHVRFRTALALATFLRFLAGLTIVGGVVLVADASSYEDSQTYIVTVLASTALSVAVLGFLAVVIEILVAIYDELHIAAIGAEEDDDE